MFEKEELVFIGNAILEAKVLGKDSFQVAALLQKIDKLVNQPEPESEE